MTCSQNFERACPLVLKTKDVPPYSRRRHPVFGKILIGLFLTFLAYVLLLPWVVPHPKLSAVIDEPDTTGKIRVHATVRSFTTMYVVDTLYNTVKLTHADGTTTSFPNSTGYESAISDTLPSYIKASVPFPRRQTYTFTFDPATFGTSVTLNATEGEWRPRVRLSSLSMPLYFLTLAEHIPILLRYTEPSYTAYIDLKKEFTLP